jgi:hypothetical protein
MENRFGKAGADSHPTPSMQTSSGWYKRHRKTMKKVEGDVTMLEVGRGDSPDSRSDDDAESIHMCMWSGNTH